MKEKQKRPICVKKRPIKKTYMHEERPINETHIYEKRPTPESHTRIEKPCGEGEVGGWGRDPKKCMGRDWGMGSSTI